MNLILFGITIESNDEPKNAFDSICFNSECDSNEIDLYFEKLFDPIVSTDAGITIDEDDLK
jgi:hypothetical protein